MIPYFPTSIRPDLVMGAINAFRATDSLQPTRRAKYAKLILAQMGPSGAHSFMRHYAHGDSMEAIFGEDLNVYEGRQSFEFTLKRLIAALRLAGHPLPLLRWPLKWVYCKYIDQFFPDLVEARYFRLPATFEEARNILGVSRQASGTELIEALLERLQVADADDLPMHSHCASRREEQCRVFYSAWLTLRGEDAIYTSSYLIEDRIFGK